MEITNIGHRRLLVAGVVAALFANPDRPSLAQDIKVEVTGSNIKRIEGEGALPVQIINRGEIDRSGATNAMEIMNLISANNSLGNVSLGNVIGATTFSNQTASLRGLGGSSTLILVNGKRLGTFSGGVTGAEGVNLAAIPFAAIDRVEVLKDGASAIYGSDAIAGVINFIMRQDFSGLDATAWYGAPTRTGGGEQYQLMATAGLGDLAKDKYNAFISFNYQEQKSLGQADRDFSRTGYLPDINLDTTSGQTFPGFISTGGIGNPGYPDCAPSIVVGNRCRYDPSAIPGVESIPTTKQLNLFGSARYQFNANWQGYLTGLYSKQESRFVIQPNPFSDQIFTTATATGASDILLPPGSPFYPTALATAAGVNGQPLNVRYRCVECGNRDTTDTNEAWQIVAGTKGTAWNWDWDFAFNYSQNTSKEQLNGGFPLFSSILPILNSGRVNLFGPNTQAITDEVRAANYNAETFNSKLQGYGLDLKGSSDIYKLPAGMMALAVGLQAGKDELSQNPNALLQTGDVSGYGGNLQSISNSRTAWAVYGELYIPIVKSLEANVAVRYDHYSDFGSTTNPKLSVRWQPLPSLLVRGSWGTGFKAPTLYQLWNPTTPGLSQAGLSDPLRCTTPDDPDNPDCNTQYVVTFGGNPALQPEKANQTTIGAVWEPRPGLSFGADWFYLDVDNIVTNGVPIATILDPALYDTYSSLVTRTPTCAGGPPCPITAIDQRFVNIGKTKIQGIDIDARLAFPTTDYGKFSALVTGTYYIQYDIQQSDGSYAGFVSNAFQAVATGITPRWKSYIAGTWERGPWSATLGNTYQSSYTDVQTDPDGNARRVSSLSLWDLQGSYTGFKQLTLTLGVKNLFDSNPPLTNSNLTFQSGYDPSYYDPRARFVYGSVRYAFR
ncbi:MAG: TonB-dependent receptor [Betaproteobacteria bacterium]